MGITASEPKAKGLSCFFFSKKTFQISIGLTRRIVDVSAAFKIPRTPPLSGFTRMVPFFLEEAYPIVKLARKYGP